MNISSRVQHTGRSEANVSSDGRKYIKVPLWQIEAEGNEMKCTAPVWMSWDDFWDMVECAKNIKERIQHETIRSQ